MAEPIIDEEEVGMSHGFNSVFGKSDDVPPPAKEDSMPEATTTKQPEAEKPAEEETQVKPDLEARYSELAAKFDALERQNRSLKDTLNGTTGNMKQELASIKNSLNEMAQMGATVKEMQAWLSNELPDLNEHMTAAEAKRLAENAAVKAEQDRAAAVETRVAEVVESKLAKQPDIAAEARRISVEVLDSFHPDRLSIMEEYFAKPAESSMGKWLAQLPAKDKQEFLDSESPAFVSKKLTEFKTWRDEKQRKDALLDDAAPAPRAGTSPHTQSNDDDEDAAMAAGFRKVRG